MNYIRRSWIVCAALLAVPVAPAQVDLFKQFQDPARQHTIMPYWSWVEQIEPAEVRSQVRRMAEQKVYGAYIFGFDGLRTPHLGPEWMAGVGAAIDEGQKLGMKIGFVTDHMWPQGDYRDIWNLDPPQSRIVRKNPEYMRRRLAFQQKTVDGPAEVEFTGLKDAKVAVAARLDASGAMLEDTLQLVTDSVSGDRFQWKAPEGRWRVMVFCLEARPMFRAYVDLMNRQAVADYIEAVLGQYESRFGPHFGKTIPSLVSDHEGEYGYRIAWTPGLFDIFAKMKGYRLEKYLPLLPFEGGRMTEKVRCDYLDVIGELYSTNYWGQVSEWLKKRGVLFTGHEWEESLLSSASYQGDLMRCFRNMSMPGIDSLYNWAEHPRHFKEAASVAHFQEKPFWCENQILQGQKSFISPQKMRLGTSLVGVWGSTNMTPWFDYGKNVVAFPPVWDWRQPFWRYFHHYADYARRISFMNSGGRHIAPVLLYHPLVTVWAHTDPLFDDARWGYGRSPKPLHPGDPDTLHIYTFGWKNAAERSEEYYFDLMGRLSDNHWDFDVADDYFLGQSRIAGGELRIGPENFRALVLPPLTTMRRAALETVRQYYSQGGIVIATGSLPTISMDQGRGDPEIARMVREIFGDVAPGADYAENRNAAGGRSYFVAKDLAKVTAILDRVAPKDFRVVSGDGTELRYLHRNKDGRDLYWVVNNTPRARENVVEVAAKGRPEKWDAAGGEKSALFYTDREKGTSLRLRFEPWEAYYVVFEKAGAPQRLDLVSTNLEEYRLEAGPRVVGSAPAASREYFIHLSDGAQRLSGKAVLEKPAAPVTLPADKWTFEPLSAVPVAYARVALDAEGKGEGQAWQNAAFDDTAWPEQWLSAERLAVTQWVCAGPYRSPGIAHAGFNVPFGPEVKGEAVEWKGCGERPAGVDAWANRIDMRLGNGGVAYAATKVYSETERKVRLELATDSAKVWINGAPVLKFHDMAAYREYRSAFARTADVALDRGWNDVLLKIEADGRTATFYFRLVEAGGNPARGLVYATRAFDVKPEDIAPKVPGYRWYRMAIPPGTAAAKVPANAVAYVNGERVAAIQGEVPVISPAGAKKVLALRLPAAEEINEYVVFRAGKTPFRLGSWTPTGLANYSGSAAYETTFDMPAEYGGKRVYLDLGEVGVTAEVWLNGERVGERVWKPFRLDITALARSGSNRLRVVVANTEANGRAVANHRPLLEKIDLNGLLGPVRLIPYAEFTLPLRSDR